MIYHECFISSQKFCDDYNIVFGGLGDFKLPATPMLCSGKETGTSQQVGGKSEQWECLVRTIWARQSSTCFDHKMPLTEPQKARGSSLTSQTRGATIRGQRWYSLPLRFRCLLGRNHSNKAKTRSIHSTRSLLKCGLRIFNRNLLFWCNAIAFPLSNVNFNNQSHLNT